MNLEVYTKSERERQILYDITNVEYKKYSKWVNITKAHIYRDIEILTDIEKKKLVVTSGERERRKGKIGAGD